MAINVELEHALNALRNSGSEPSTEHGMAQLFDANGQRSIVVTLWFARHYVSLFPEWTYEELSNNGVPEELT